MSDHKQIWLECECGSLAGHDRMWCEDVAFDECGEPGCKGPVRYVLATENDTNREALAAKDALIAELVEALETMRSYGDDPYGIARKAIAKAREAMG